MTWLREALIAVTVVYCKAQSEFEDGEEPIKVKPAKGVGLNLNVLGSSFAADGMPDFDAWFTVKCFMTIVALFYGYSLFKVLFRGEAPYPGAAKDQKKWRKGTFDSKPFKGDDKDVLADWQRDFKRCVDGTLNQHSGISQGVFYAIEPENNGGRKSYKPLNAEVSGETQEELYTSFVRFLQTRAKIGMDTQGREIAARVIEQITATPAGWELAVNSLGLSMRFTRPHYLVILGKDLSIRVVWYAFCTDDMQWIEEVTPWVLRTSTENLNNPAVIERRHTKLSFEILNSGTMDEAPRLFMKRDLDTVSCLMYDPVSDDA